MLKPPRKQLAKDGYAPLIESHAAKFTFRELTDVEGLAARYSALGTSCLCSLLSDAPDYSTVADAINHGARAYEVSYEDAFGVLEGAIALFCAYMHRNILYVENLIASQRLYHKGFEAAFNNWALAMAQKAHAQQIVIRGCANSRNGEFVEAFCALGYTETSLSARDHILVLAQPNNFVGHLNIQVAAEWPPDILPPKELHGSLRPDITVFLVPHQDDELYTYGLAIRSRIAAGQNLCTILVADGGACEARGILNDGGSCECLGDSHAYELSVDEFVEARDREYVESCQLLGLPEGNIHFAEHRLPDVQVTEQGSAAIILKVLLSYPFATICAHAPRFEVSMDPSERCLSSAPHHDHCMIGRAVERLIAEGVLYSAEFFIEFYDIERFKRENKDIFLLEREVSNEEVRGVQAALAAYKKWDPESGRFAVGWHSGAEYFEWAEENNVITSYDPMLSHFEDIPSQALANHIVELQADNRSCQERLLQLLKQLDVVERRLSELESSTTWKVGRIVMALPCKAKELLQSIRGL